MLEVAGDGQCGPVSWDGDLLAVHHNRNCSCPRSCSAALELHSRRTEFHEIDLNEIRDVELHKILHGGRSELDGACPGDHSRVR